MKKIIINIIILRAKKDVFQKETIETIVIIRRMKKLWYTEIFKIFSYRDLDLE